MVKRVVQKTFTFEQQRQEINLLADDVNDTQLLDTVNKDSIVDSINEVIDTPEDEIFIDENDSANGEKPLLFADSITLSTNYAASKPNISPSTNPNGLDYATVGYDGPTNIGITYNPSLKTVTTGNFQGNVKNESGEVILDVNNNQTLSQYTGLLKSSRSDSVSVVSAVYANNIVSVTTSAPHNLDPGNIITISGFSPSGYNTEGSATQSDYGDVVIDTPSPISFTYFRSTNPGALVTPGSLVKQVPIDIRENLMLISQAAQVTLERSSNLELITGIDTGAFVNVTNSDKVIYVNANDENASDSVDNNGRNLNRPFKSIERALLEAGKRSYVSGAGREDGEAGADRFEYFSIILFPGEYIIDNSPGDPDAIDILAETDDIYKTTDGFASEISKFNPITGGVIVPRGTSIVGLDLRKTIVRPKYVPDAVSGDRSAMFRLTGGCYIWQFTVKDDLNTEASHHKLTVFEYASYDDLELYYQKVDVYSELNQILGDEYNQRVEENRIVGFVQNKDTADTVASASPYVFNISLRSVWGMCGLHADGSRTTGLKSMVLAQYTGISLQKDDRAFIYNGDTTTLVNDPDNRHSESLAEYRYDWRHYHVKSSNNGFLQVVSVFAVGQADHFMAETGGDHSVTNSNSNFGNRSISCISHRPDVFKQDDGGYIVGILPPRGLNPNKQSSITINDIDFKATLKKYNDALNDTQPGEFRKIYLSIGGDEFITQDQVPEFYSTYDNEDRAELLIDDINYILGKREYSDGLPEAIYCNLPKNYETPTIQTFAARLRDNRHPSVQAVNGNTDAPVGLDPEYTYSQGIISTFTTGGSPQAKSAVKGPIETFSIYTTTDGTTQFTGATTLNPGTYTIKPSGTLNASATFSVNIANNGTINRLYISPGRITSIFETGTAVSGDADYVISSGQYTFTPGVNSAGNGVGAQFKIYRRNESYIVYVENGGNNYEIGDTFTVPGTLLGGGSANTCTIQVKALDTSGNGYTAAPIGTSFTLSLSDGTNITDIYLKIDSVVLPRNVLVNTTLLLDYVSAENPDNNYILEGDGYDAKFNVRVVDGGGNSTLFSTTLISGGSGFRSQETFKFPGSLFNGNDNGAVDLVITVTNVTGTVIETKNAIRKFYGWEYARTVDGVYLGRLCLLVDDFRDGGIQTVYGIPTQFDYTPSSAEFSGFEPQTTVEQIASATREEIVRSRTIDSITSLGGSSYRVTTSFRHGFYPGDLVSITNVTPDVFNVANIEIEATPTNTQFDISIPITGATYLTGGTAFITVEQKQVAVRITILADQAGNGQITAIYPFDYDTSLTLAQNLVLTGNWSSSGSGFIGEFTQGNTTELGDVLTINTGAGTSLIPVLAETVISFTVQSTVNNANSPYSSENIKENDYIETSSSGTRYGAYDQDVPLELQRPKNLSLLRRLTQRIDSNADEALDQNNDSFEFNSRTINNIYIKRIQDARSANGNTELLWRAIYKVPKQGYGNVKLRGPETKFVIQLKDPALKFPYTYKEETDPDFNKGPRSFYVSNAETITEYRYNIQDGYYLLTILNGNVFTDVGENLITNDIQYTDQRLVGFNGNNEIEHRIQDGSDLIETSFTKIQEETFGYLINKYPYIYFSDDDPSTNRYKDAARLILFNKEEIQDRALAELAYQYVIDTNANGTLDTFKYGANWFIPGDANPATTTAQNGRSLYYDAYRLIQYNRQQIIDNAFNAISAAFPTFINPEPNKCRRDIGYFIDAVSLDLFTLNNKYTRKFISFYYDANGNPILGGLGGEELQSKTAFNSARDNMILAMRNQLGVTDTATAVDPNSDAQGVCANVASAINTLTLIVTQVLDGTLSISSIPSEGGSTFYARNLTTTVAGLDTGSIKCRRDIGYFIDSTVRDLSTGGNAWTIDYTERYFSAATTLTTTGIAGEQVQTVDSLNKARDQMILAMTNQLYVQDLTLIPDPLTGSNKDVASCTDVALDITNLIGIATDAFTAPIGTPTSTGVIKNYGSFSNSGKCKRDVGYILRAILRDLRLGGNASVIDTIKFYFANATEQFVDEELTETIDAYSYLEDIVISAMRNWDAYLSGVSINTTGVVTVGSTKGLMVGMKVRQINRLPTSPTNYQTPPYTIPAGVIGGYNNPSSYTVSTINTNIPVNAESGSGGFYYIKEILNDTQFVLGSTRFGLPYNGTIPTTTTGASLYLHVKMEQFMGLNWTSPSTTAPIFTAINSEGDTVLEDFYASSTGAGGWTGGPLGISEANSYECADVRQALITQFTLINNILSSKPIVLSTSGTLATATVTGGHGLTGSPTVNIFGAEQNVFNGNQQVTVTSPTTFTYTLTTTPDVLIDYGRLVSSGSIVRTEPTRSTYKLKDILLTGIGYSQNINYLYPEVDLDNPKWNPKPSVSRYDPIVGNCIIKNNNLVPDGYERVTQYSITSESMRDFLNEILTAGDVSDKCFSKLNPQLEFGISSFTDNDIINPYPTTELNEYGVDSSPVLEFDSATNNPIFTERCLIFKIPVPVSLFRPSIIRASSHTWEYVGFGPGNYSTALPQFQDVNLNIQQRVNSQNVERAGGFAASSGTNSFGDFYIGNQVIDTKGNATNTLNFPKVKTSAENRLINFNDALSLASNSSSAAFNPSSFSKVLTNNLTALQEAQRNAFKAANIEAANSTIGSLKITGRISIANSVFDNTSAFPDARRDEYGFVKRASLNWYNNEPGSEEFNLLDNSYISPTDLVDWANKNSLIPSTPVTWNTVYVPTAQFNDASNVGIVDIINTFKKSANFIVEGIDPLDSRWYDPVTNTISIPLGTPIDSEKQTGILEYEGRAGLIFISFAQSVNASAIIPTNIWKPVDNNWNGISAEDGSPTTYLTGRYFLVGYYITGGRIFHTTNVINI